jgi:hypothetical protein
MNQRRPTVFIGSSSEGRKVADAFQVSLDEVCEVVVWSQGPFGLSEGRLEALVKALEHYDFAILVVTADDLRESRGVTNAIPRDNVVFELGLFMGGLGSKRTFIVCERGKDIALPSDLAGLDPVTFAMHKSGNVASSVGAAATKIREAIEQQGHRESDLTRRLDDVQRSVAAAGQTGPEELAYYDKLSQLLESSSTSRLTLLYTDIDGLRSITRRIFLEERTQRGVAGTRLGRRPESQIRGEFLLALSIALTDAVYARHPHGLKHDIFQLPDPDAVLVGRDLTYDDALEVARQAQAAFRAEAAHLWGAGNGGGPGVTALVGNAAWLRDTVGVRHAGEVHPFMRQRLKALKDEAGRGQVFGHPELAKATTAG